MLKSAQNKFNQMNLYYQDDRKSWQNNSDTMMSEIKISYEKILEFEQQICFIRVQNQNITQNLKAKNEEVQELQELLKDKEREIEGLLIIKNNWLELNKDASNYSTTFKKYLNYKSFIRNSIRRSFSLPNIHDYANHQIIKINRSLSLSGCTNYLEKKIKMTNHLAYALKQYKTVNKNMQNKIINLEHLLTMAENYQNDINSTHLTQDIENIKSDCEKEKISNNYLTHLLDTERNRWKIEKQSYNITIKQLEEKVDSLKVEFIDSNRRNSAAEKIKLIEKRSNIELSWNVERKEFKKQLDLANENIKNLHHEIYNMQQGYDKQRYRLFEQIDEEKGMRHKEREELIRNLYQHQEQLSQVQSMSEVSMYLLKSEIDKLKEKNESLQKIVQETRRRRKKAKSKLELFLKDIQIFRHSRSETNLKEETNEKSIKNDVLIRHPIWDKNNNDMELTLSQISEMTKQILLYNKLLSKQKENSKKDFLSASYEQSPTSLTDISITSHSLSLRDARVLSLSRLGNKFSQSPTNTISSSCNDSFDKTSLPPDFLSRLKIKSKSFFKSDLNITSKKPVLFNSSLISPNQNLNPKIDESPNLTLPKDIKFANQSITNAKISLTNKQPLIKDKIKMFSNSNMYLNQRKNAPAPVCFSNNSSFSFNKSKTPVQSLNLAAKASALKNSSKSLNLFKKFEGPNYNLTKSFRPKIQTNSYNKMSLSKPIAIVEGQKHELPIYKK
ncbi:uncharacterized protein LOC135929772 [Gordionus sp. m RMFG-2023]|uniref:uncharacterized protein LOC135929772 n=1 Tax=Gordionus sp. m RMFG-2023 TaxID=3053472 RepID=UPI0031FC63F1